MLEKHSSLVNYGGLAFGDRGEYRYLFGVIKLSYFSNGKKKKKGEKSVQIFHYNESTGNKPF